jgi:hypothetical protein
MVSPTLQEISMNKQTIFDGREQILLFLCGTQIVYHQFLKIYWS